MNIIAILVVTLGINTWGMAYYGLDKFPDWAAEGNHTVSCEGVAPYLPTTPASIVTTMMTTAIANATQPLL